MYEYIIFGSMTFMYVIIKIVRETFELAFMLSPEIKMPRNFT